MAGFVLGHLVNGVVDGIVAEFLGALGDLKLGGTSTLFGIGAKLEILLRGVGHDLAEKLGKFGGVFSLFEGVALEGFGDFGITFALSLARHRQIHSHFAAFAVEVVAEALHDFGVIDLAVTDGVLARPGLLAAVGFLADEFFAGNSAKWAFRRSFIAGVRISARGANPFFHGCGPFFFCGWENRLGT